MKTVHEVSQLTGVSIRALHHYDQLGLLPPSRVTQAGYRLYDDAALTRLQSILFFRELGFPLKQIRDILDSPDFDRREALSRQLELLRLERQRIDRMIDLARDALQKGENTMDFSAFDRTELDARAAEAKARWGNTDAWAESQARQTRRSEAETQAAAEGLMALLARFGALQDKTPEGPEAQALAGQLRQYITTHFYNCTPEIFRGLGELYATDDRFRASIDAVGGDGAAAFAARAIGAYCAAVS